MNTLKRVMARIFAYLMILLYMGVLGIACLGMFMPRGSMWIWGIDCVLAIVFISIESETGFFYKMIDRATE